MEPKRRRSVHEGVSKAAQEFQLARVALSAGVCRRGCVRNRLWQADLAGWAVPSADGSGFGDVSRDASAAVCNISRNANENGERWKRIVTLAGLYFAFAYYLFMLYCFLFAGGRADYDYSYNPINWIPFQQIFAHFANGDSFGNLAFLVLGYLKNAALFVPLGFFLPFTGKRMKHLGLVTMVSFLLIIAVELTQYWTKAGFFDVDDVICNLLGVVCGYGISRLYIIQEILRFVTNTQRRYLARQRNESERDIE